MIVRLSFIDDIEQAAKNYSSNAEKIDNICDADSTQQTLLELRADAK